MSIITRASSEGHGGEPSAGGGAEARGRQTGETVAQEEGVRDGGMEGKDTKEDPALAAPSGAQEGSMVQIEFQ